ncbi:MAG: thioredoxin family protein, partial [Gaiellaceae bacterium]
MPNELPSSQAVTWRLELPGHADRVLEVTDETFADEVVASPVPVIVDFWAPWCKPCDAIEPHLVSIAEQYGARVRLVRMNV